MIVSQWSVLAEFQLKIADRWRDRGNEATDAFARFFFYFAGFNALYYLWSKIDNVRGRAGDQPPNEGRQIEHLLGKSTPADAAKIVVAARPSVDFFLARRPIERMDKRSSARATAGDPHEGRKYQNGLRTGADPERLRALGAILYLVRSNLVHGSKMDQGDDADVIESATSMLKVVLEWAVRFTRAELTGS